MTKRPNLASLTDRLAAKPGATPPAPEEKPRRERADRQPDGRKGVPLRMSVTAWKQLRRLAADREATLQDLLTEAVNDLFGKNGLPPIA